MFTSEDYGDGFAEYLRISHKDIALNNHVTHECLDLNRNRYPVSATHLRNGKKSSKPYLSRSVSKDFNVKSVCLLGRESTGKSTLCESLAAYWNEPVAKEYGRTRWKEKKGNLNQDDLIHIAQTQTELENRLQLEATEYLFCDTSPITTLCYSQAMFDTRPDSLEAFAERNYHYTFLCEPDFPFFQDGTRKDESFRQWQHQWYLTELARRNIEYSVLRGTLSQRLEQVCKRLDGNNAIGEYLKRDIW